MSDQSQTPEPAREPGRPEGGSQRSHGPRLPELVVPLWQRLRLPGRIALVAVLVALVGLALVYRADRRTALDRVTVKPDAAPAFTLSYTDSLPTVEPHGGELVQLESRDADDVLINRMTVVPLEIEDRPGTLGARLPLDAIPYARRARKRYEGYRPVLEGRTRLNGIEGYQIAFSARYTDPAGLKRRMLGKIVLLPELADDPSSGLAVEMLATSLAGVPQATQVGNRGALTRPFRSLRMLEPDA